MPVSMFHGTKDGVIPIAHAAGLQAVLKPGDRFITIDGAGHNDLPAHVSYTRAMDSLLIPQE